MNSQWVAQGKGTRARTLAEVLENHGRRAPLYLKHAPKGARTNLLIRPALPNTVTDVDLDRMEKAKVQL